MNRPSEKPRAVPRTTRLRERWSSAPKLKLTPVITSVSPASGSAGGGNAVTITGKYLDSVVNVVFGSTPAISFKV